MKYFGFSEFRIRTKVIWSVLLVASMTVLGFAVVSATQYPLYKITVLFAAIFISALLNQYELRLPKTHIEITTSDVIAFWGVFWLGVGGGVLLAFAASSARTFREREFSAKGIFSICITVLSIGTAAFAFSFLNPLTGDSGLQWIGTQNTAWILNGTFLMSAISFVVFNSFDLLFRKFEGLAGQRFGTIARNRSIAIFPIAGATIVLCALFNHFGIAFGLVLVPLAIAANLAYRIHLNRLQQKTAQILEASRIHLATVEALATAIDARDQVGNGHVRRTQIYAVGLGKAIGLGDDDNSALCTGALLHDIGKLAVPDHILSKADTLTPAELEKTKIHASVGASILEKVGFQYPVVPTVKHHHEHWDGQGYPDGLAGESIPLTARILAIADIYDTMRSDRPFRPALSREDAREYLRVRTGTQFDPVFVGVFLKHLATFEAEIEREGLSYVDNESPVRRSIDSYGQNYVDQIKLANKEVFTLFELAREFGSVEDLPDMLAMYTAKIRQLIPFDTCSVYLLDHSRRFATATHVEGENETLLKSRRIKVGEGATGIVLKKREMIKNVNPDLDFSLSHLELIQQYSTMASLPLIAEDELIGAVSIYSHDLPGYGDEHIRLLETVSHIAAEAIAKSQEHDQTKVHAMTDPMTGLPNARSLQIHFEKEVGRSRRMESNFQVLVMDLDGFKAVNDTFGHKVGDEMLRMVGKVISEQLRDYDFLSRYGGDEFVAVIPEADQNMVADLCSRVERAVCEMRLPVEGERFATVGISLGSAGYPEQGQTFDQMIIAADKAMYVRKSSRKLAGANPRKSPTAPMSEVLALISNDGAPVFEISDRPSNDGFIVELDESHVISTISVN